MPLIVCDDRAVVGEIFRDFSAAGALASEEVEPAAVLSLTTFTFLRRRRAAIVFWTIRSCLVSPVTVPGSAEAVASGTCPTITTDRPFWASDRILRATPTGITDWS